MFERMTEPLIPRGQFYRRLAVSGAVAAALILVSLTIGIAGYHFIAGLPWIDALLNASMILGGMGPVADFDVFAAAHPELIINLTAAKVFASSYALFSGVAFLTSVSVFLSPALHRLLHHFHLPQDEDEAQGPPAHHRPRG
jgi:hypothetical protein